MHGQLALDKLELFRALEATKEGKAQFELAIVERDDQLAASKVRMVLQIHHQIRPEMITVMLTCQALRQECCSTHDFQGHHCKSSGACSPSDTPLTGCECS